MIGRYLTAAAALLLLAIPSFAASDAVAQTEGLHVHTVTGSGESGVPASNAGDVDHEDRGVTLTQTGGDQGGTWVVGPNVAAVPNDLLHAHAVCVRHHGQPGWEKCAAIEARYQASRKLPPRDDAADHALVNSVSGSAN